MIHYPSFNPYRNGEFVKFTDLAVSILNSYDSESFNMSEAVNQVKAAHHEIKAVYKTDRGSNLTKAIVKKDLQRDNMNSGITQILHAHANYHPDEKMRNKADELLIVFEKHGTDINRQSYHQQTANFDDIFEDIDRKGLNSLLKELNVDIYYNELVSANKNFDILYLKRNKEYAEAPDENLTDLREQAEEALMNLFERINAFITIEGPGHYQDLTDELNALIENYETNIEKRLHRNSSKNEELNQDFDETVED
jgi:hypothetical protein